MTNTPQNPFAAYQFVAELAQVIDRLEWLHPGAKGEIVLGSAGYFDHIALRQGGRIRYFDATGRLLR